MHTQFRAYWLGLFLALPCTVALALPEPDLSKVEIKVTRVAGSVYLLEGSGGNIAASVGDDGIVLVDDEFAPLADRIRAALKGIADRPIRFIINTHFHFDHTGGNIAFQKDVPIIAQDNVRKRMEHGGPSGNGGSFKFDTPPATKEALPVITFARDVTVHLNGEDIGVMHYPNGHTDTDSMVYFSRSNVLHTGDDFVTYGFPFVDRLNGGSVQGMIDALEQASKLLPADVKIVPGHGPISNLADVRRYLDMLKGTRAAVAKGAEQGKTLTQLQQAKVLAGWESWSHGFQNADMFIETLYGDITHPISN
jgi:cyclase